MQHLVNEIEQSDEILHRVIENLFDHLHILPFNHRQLVLKKQPHRILHPGIDLFLLLNNIVKPLHLTRTDLSPVLLLQSAFVKFFLLHHQEGFQAHDTQPGRAPRDHLGTHRAPSPSDGGHHEGLPRADLGFSAGHQRRGFWRRPQGVAPRPATAAPAPRPRAAWRCRRAADQPKCRIGSCAPPCQSDLVRPRDAGRKGLWEARSARERLELCRAPT